MVAKIAKSLGMVSGGGLQSLQYRVLTRHFFLKLHLGHGLWPSPALLYLLACPWGVLHYPCTQWFSDQSWELCSLFCLILAHPFTSCLSKCFSNKNGLCLEKFGIIFCLFFFLIQKTGKEKCIFEITVLFKSLLIYVENKWKILFAIKRDWQKSTVLKYTEIHSRK